MTNTYIWYACKSILPSLVACVEFSYYILGYNLVVTHYVAQKAVWGCWIIKQYQTDKVLFNWYSKLNGVRLQN